MNNFSPPLNHLLLHGIGHGAAAWTTDSSEEHRSFALGFI